MPARLKNSNSFWGRKFTVFSFFSLFVLSAFFSFLLVSILGFDLYLLGLGSPFCEKEQKFCTILSGELWNNDGWMERNFFEKSSPSEKSLIFSRTRCKLPLKRNSSLPLAFSWTWKESVLARSSGHWSGNLKKGAMNDRRSMAKYFSDGDSAPGEPPEGR